MDDPWGPFQDFQRGYEAGFRRDELIEPKSQEYMDGYDAGQLSREAEEERSSRYGRER